MLRLVTILLCALLVTQLNAEVYSLFPFSRSTKPSAKSLAKVLNPENVLTESVVINGVSAEMRMGLIYDSLVNCLKILKGQFPKASCRIAEGTARISIKDENHYIRILLINLGRGPTIQFSMKVPDDIPKKFSWPSVLPMTSDGIPIKYFHYPERKSYYGLFSTSLNSESAMDEISSKLQSIDWTPASRAVDSLAQSGGVFINKSKMEIMLVNFKNGKGTVYTRPVKNKK